MRQLWTKGALLFPSCSCRTKGKLRDKFSTLENQGLACRISLSHNGAMKYGYARVSTDDQNTALQLVALQLPLDVMHLRSFQVSPGLNYPGGADRSAGGIVAEMGLFV